MYFKDVESLDNVYPEELLNAFCDFDSSTNSINEFLNSDFVEDRYLKKYLQTSMSTFNSNVGPMERLNQLAIFEFNFALPFWELE